MCIGDWWIRRFYMSKLHLFWWLWTILQVFPTVVIFEVMRLFQFIAICYYLKTDRSVQTVQNARRHLIKMIGNLQGKSELSISHLGYEPLWCNEMREVLEHHIFLRTLYKRIAEFAKKIEIFMSYQVCKNFRYKKWQTWYI